MFPWQKTLSTLMVRRSVGLSSRQASTAALQSAATKAVGKVQSIAEPLIYYSRVTLEVLKLVAQHQKISIPTPGHFAEAQGALGSFFSATQNGAWKAITLAQVGRGLLETVKIGGFFYVGEMIGRRSLVGYDIEGTGGHSHH